MRVIQMPASPKNAKKCAPPMSNPVSNATNTEINKGTRKGINFKELLSKLEMFEKDDYILAGIIVTLMLEGCDDYILLAALGYLFIMGILPEIVE